MKIYSQKQDVVTTEVSLFLTKDEAEQMISYLKDLIENPTDNSAKLYDESHSKAVTLVVYDLKDRVLKGFSSRVKKVILEDM